MPKRFVSTIDFIVDAGVVKARFMAAIPAALTKPLTAIFFLRICLATSLAQSGM